jgi:alpha-glucosidase
MSTIVKETGKILEYSHNETTIFLNCENADVQISFYSQAIARVEVAFGRDFGGISYAVEVDAQHSLYKLTDEAMYVQVNLGNFVMKIHKSPFAIDFLTPDGRPINCDEQGLFNSLVDSRITAYKTMQKGERFIGLGEKCGGLDKAGGGFTNINTDSFAYGTQSDPLYATFPFYIGLHNSLCYGIFLDNSYQSDFNFGASNRRFSSFGVRGGNLNYYFIYTNSIASIIESYTQLTGRMSLPPLWTLGYHQNRYSYYPDSTVLRIADTLRENKIPCDSITLDIHYMHKYRPFTWNRDRFPNPRKLVATLGDKGFKTTLIVDPGIAANDATPNGINSNSDKNIFVKYSDGCDYQGEVWAGWCKFPDFTAHDARKWWAQKLTTLLDKGIAGLWNDMNEISTWGQQMPDNLIFNYDGELASHLKARNVYGMQMARASHDAFVEFNRRRPFILTRAAFAGIQRYSAVWTGDNSSSFSHLTMGLRMLMGLGITGVAFSGMDIGGFLGEPSPELYVRWMQIGAFIPYMRNHKQVNTKSAEPWTLGETAMEDVRNSINLRYRLIPYIYSLFREASLSGMPLVRTLAIEHPFDDNVYSKPYENQFCFGDALMIAPFDEIQKYGEIYFPNDEYYDFYTDRYLEISPDCRRQIVALSIHRIPLYVRAGSIIPMQNIVQHTGEFAGDTLFIHIYKGSQQHVFRYYEDDGISFAYLDGEYHEREILYNPENNNITFGKAQGNMSSKFWQIKLVLHGFDRLRTIAVSGKTVEISSETISFMQAISAFEPQAEEIGLGECSVKCVEFENNRDIIEIQIDENE